MEYLFVQMPKLCHRCSCSEMVLETETQFQLIMRIKPHLPFNIVSIVTAKLMGDWAYFEGAYEFSPPPKELMHYCH